MGGVGGWLLLLLLLFLKLGNPSLIQVLSLKSQMRGKGTIYTFQNFYSFVMFEFCNQRNDTYTQTLKKADFKMQLKSVSFMQSCFKPWLKRELFFHKIVSSI